MRPNDHSRSTPSSCGAPGNSASSPERPRAWWLVAARWSPPARPAEDGSIWESGSRFKGSSWGPHAVLPCTGRGKWWTFRGLLWYVEHRARVIAVSVYNQKSQHLIGVVWVVEH